MLILRVLLVCVLLQVQHLVNGKDAAPLPKATSELLTSARSGDIATLLRFINDENFDVEMKWKSELPLHLAAEHGHVKYVKTLLEAGVHVDVKDHDGLRAITVAVLSNQLDVVSCLLSHGADIFAADIVDDSTYDLLETAASQGHAAIVSLLLHHGADVNVQSPEKNTPLIMAALYGHVETVEVLLAHSALVDMRNVQGNTALIAAAFKGHANVTRQLLDAGADVNILNNDRTSPLVFAARSNYHRVIRELLRSNADPNLPDPQSNYPLIICSRSGHIDCMNMLMSAGAFLDAVDGSGSTALQHAYTNNHRTASKMLALAGASHGSGPGHTGLSNGCVPKVFACYWFRGILKRHNLSQSQLTAPELRACEHLAAMGYTGSIIKLLDQIAFYGYKVIVDKLDIDSFGSPEQSDAIEAAKRDARNELKDMHSKDYREHFRQQDEDEMEKSIPSMLKKFGAKIAEPKTEQELEFEKLAEEGGRRRQVHRPPHEERPDHVQKTKTKTKTKKILETKTEL